MPRINRAEVQAVVESAVVAFREFMHRRALRVTGAREEIVRAAVEHPGHFRVDELVAALRARNLDVSPATVYRALPSLIDAGIIQPTELTGKPGAYEAVFGRGDHQHLICRGCGKVVEFEFEAFQILEREVAARHDFELLGHVHELIGLCGACRGNGT